MLLEKTVENPLDCKEIKPVNPKGNQSRIFTGGTDFELKFQYFGYLMWRTDSLKRPWFWERFEGRRRGWQRTQWLDSIPDSLDRSMSKLWETVEIGKPGVLQSMGLQRIGHDCVTEQQRKFTWLKSMWLHRLKLLILIFYWVSYMMMPNVVVVQNILLNRIIIFDRANVLLTLVFSASK